MKKFDRNLTSLESIFRSHRKMGDWEPEQFEDAAKALEALRHALKIGNLRQAKAAIEDLARVFLHAKHV